MSKRVAQESLVVIAEPMIQTGGHIMLSSRKRKQSPIFFKLINDEFVQCELIWTDKGFPLAVGSTVKMLCNPKAQVAAGRRVGGPDGKWEMHGTRGFPGAFASAAMIGNCPGVGAKMLLPVSSGTESWASDRSPSYPTKRNVLSLIMGKLRVPPNC